MWKLCLTSTFSELVNMSDSYHLVIHSFVHTTLLPTNPSLGGPDSLWYQHHHNCWQPKLIPKSHQEREQHHPRLLPGGADR